MKNEKSERASLNCLKWKIGQRRNAVSASVPSSQETLSLALLAPSIARGPSHRAHAREAKEFNPRRDKGSPKGVRRESLHLGRIEGAEVDPE